MRRLAIAVVVGLLAVLPACGDDDGGGATTTAPTSVPTTTSSTTSVTTVPSTTTASTTTAPTTTAVPTSPAPTTAVPTTAAPTTAPTGTTDLRVYFLRDEQIVSVHRQVPRTMTPATIAMEELLRGPTAKESGHGAGTTIPVGTRLRGINLDNGVATVDLTGQFDDGGGTLSMMGRISQVVFTLTQFDNIDAVVFWLDGERVTMIGGEGIIVEEPQTRADWEGMSPVILVESPGLGGTIRSPLRVWGSANTFEAVFRLQLLGAGGTVVHDQQVTATSGTGTRGTFDVTFPYQAPAGTMTLRLFEHSAEDGAPINQVELPVTNA